MKKKIALLHMAILFGLTVYIFAPGGEEILPVVHSQYNGQKTTNPKPPVRSYRAPAAATPVIETDIAVGTTEDSKVKEFSLNTINQLPELTYRKMNDEFLLERYDAFAKALEKQILENEEKYVKEMFALFADKNSRVSRVKVRLLMDVAMTNIRKQDAFIYEAAEYLLDSEDQGVNDHVTKEVESYLTEELVTDEWEHANIPPNVHKLVSNYEDPLGNDEQ